MTQSAVTRTPSSRYTRRVTFFALFLLAASSAALVAERRLRPPFGAVAEYFAQPDWSGPVRVRTVDQELTTGTLTRDWPWKAEPFSVRWEGWLLVPTTGAYRLAASSDDGSFVFVDDVLVIDNGGRHEGRMAVVTRDLTRGIHRFRVEYFQAGGDKELEVLWGRVGERLRLVSGPVLLTTPPSAAALRWWPRVRAIRNLLVAAMTFLVFAAVIALSVVGPVRALVAREALGNLPRDVRAVLVAVALLALIGIWWGLPGPGWAADELVPGEYAGAVDARFSNGWWSKYPPGHYQLVIALSSPLWLLRSVDPAAFDDHWGELGVFLIARSLSAAMTVGAVLVIYLCGRRVVGHRPALFSAALFGSLPPVVYYAKVANLDAPYLFWYVLALLAFVRLYDDPSNKWDLFVYAGGAAMAICTKDQAYALFVLPSIAIVWRQWQTGRADVRTTAAAAATAGVLFLAIHNIAFNMAGFAEHVRSITGPQSGHFRIFDRGWTGQWEMFKVTVLLLVAILGVPACLLAAVGATTSLAPGRFDDSARGRLWWLTIPPISYYLTFIAVVGYNYDRFLLPLALTLALFAGAGAAALLEHRGVARTTATALMVLALAVTTGRAVLVDLAMLSDSRYRVEEWMSAHVTAGETIGVIGLTEFLPRLPDFRSVRFLALDHDDLVTVRAGHFIVNTEFARRYRPGSEQYATYDQLVTGSGLYRRVAAIRTRLPFESLSYRAALQGLESFSNLSKINPEMLVLERVSY